MDIVFDEPGQVAASQGGTRKSGQSTSESHARSSEQFGDLAKAKKSRSNYRKRALFWRVSPPPLPDMLENRRWHKVQLEFARLNLAENSVFFDNRGRTLEPKPILDPVKAFDFVLSKYVRFNLIAKRLNDCYLYLVHPQKRELLRTCLSAVITRILELKNELVEIDQREYHFYEDSLHDHKCTHDEIELSVPLFIREERAQVLRDRERILASLYNRQVVSVISESGISSMTKQEAVALIQRQTRFYLSNIKKEHAHKVLRSKGAEWTQAVQRRVLDKWKKGTSRNEAATRKMFIDTLLEMIPDPETPFVLPGSTTDMDPLAARNIVKAEELAKEYELDRAQVEADIISKEGPTMSWSIKYNIEQWLLEVRDVLGKFPPIPEPEEGGSAFLFSDAQISDVEEYLDENIQLGSVGKYWPVEKPKPPKKEKIVVKPGPWGKEGFEYIIDETKCMRTMKEKTSEYRDLWYYRDDSDNILQKHDVQLLKEQIRPGVYEEIRLQVDELIRQELDNLTFAIDRVPRAGDKKGKKKEKKSKEKKSKGKEKDMTADRTIEELFEELVIQGIIVYSPAANLSDFLGEYSFSGAALDLAKKDPLPSLADVRRMVTEFAVLPLSSQQIHENAPLIRKLLITGVRDTGKKLLLRAICHEVGANLFDLTPSNLEGKYDNPQGKKMLMHLIMKVGKALEPSIFWVGESEKLFLKKKDKMDTSKPHQWAGVLHKTLKKGIKNGDRMMLIGTSSTPSLTKQKKFNQFFDRIVLVPVPDYISRYQAWKHFISLNLEEPLPPYFDLSSLTKVTAGYTIGSIKKTCEEVLTAERKRELIFYPLQPSDFIHHIWRYDPVYEDEQEQLLQWYAGTPLAKLRQARVHAEDED